jgi:hypothetical protein
VTYLKDGANMMKYRVIAVVIMILACVSIGRADIIGWDCVPDGDGAISALPASWSENGGEYYLGMNIDQFWGPGHMNGGFTTNTAADPTIWVRNVIENDTTFTWTDYHINVYMNVPFTLSDATAYDPNDWTTNIVPASWNGTKYVGTINYYAGTPVPINDTLDIGYKLAFDSATSYSYCQEMIPTPEPGTLVLIVCGLVSLFVARRRFA